MALNDPSRSRRRVFKSLPVALGAFGIGSAVAEDEVTPSNHDPIICCGSGGYEKHLFTDQNSDSGGFSAHSGLCVTVKEAQGRDYRDFDILPIACSGNVVTVDSSDGTPQSNVRSSGQSVDWSAGSAEGNTPLVNAWNTEEYIGKFDSTMSGEGNADPLEAAISAGVGLLPGAAGFGASFIVSVMINYLEESLKDDTKIERNWEYGYGEAKQASWYGKYDIMLNPGESFTFTVSDYADTYPGSAPVVQGGDITVEMPNNPDTSTIRTEIDRSQLEAAGPDGVDLSHHTEGLRVFSGRVAKNNPQFFSALDIDDIEDDELVYKYPVKTRVISRNVSLDKFDLRNR